MNPLLDESDVILVRVGPEFSAGDVIVARSPSDGYVVKYVEAADGRSIRLSSLNPDHSGLEIDAASNPVVGTVVARMRRSRG